MIRLNSCIPKNIGKHLGQDIQATFLERGMEKLLAQNKRYRQGKQLTFKYFPNIQVVVILEVAY